MTKLKQNLGIRHYRLISADIEELRLSYLRFCEGLYVVREQAQTVNFLKEDLRLLGHFEDYAGASALGRTNETFPTGLVRRVARDTRSNAYLTRWPLVAFHLQYVSAIVFLFLSGFAAGVFAWVIGQILVFSAINHAARELARNAIGYFDLKLQDLGFTGDSELIKKHLELYEKGSS